jgi:hypothetical protein
MHLQLGPSAFPLLDGSESWGASAAGALAVWNSHITATQLAAVHDSAASRGPRNGVNNVYFSNNVNGQAWGSGVLAVTITYSAGSATTETDVLFNNNLAWNSYRGATRFANGSQVYDFHRIALHEFGHALGLDHPDAKGQSVSALMNSRISALDALTSDDIRGAQSLYGAAEPVVSLPTIATHPASRSVQAGGSTTFTVAATSAVALSYQWLKSGLALNGATSPSHTISNVAAADAGNYSVVVSNSAGSVTSSVAVLTVTLAPAPPTTPPVANGAPAIASGPASQTTNSGGNVTLSVTASGSGPLSYQWLKDGQEIPGATAAIHTFANARSSDAGSYQVRISNGAGSIFSPAAELTVRSSRLINLSTRAFVPAGSTLTPGFFIRGSGTKPLLIRAVGPTLRRFGVTTALPETKLEVYPPGSASPLAREAYPALSDIDVAISVGAFPLDPDARDTSVQTTLAPQAYTVRISGGDAGMMGVTLAEIYDTDALQSSAQLVNVSTLGFVGAGENVLTAGFVVSGDAPKRLLLRAVGPGLTAFGVGDALPDPQLALMSQAGTEPLLINDNWPDSDVVRSAFSLAGAFALQGGSKDAALIVTLEPGAYTAVVSSVTASITGQALVEIYDLDP